jgi:hypothetical protein
MALLFAVYVAFITTIPTFGHNSPYYPQLPSTILLLYAKVPYSFVLIYHCLGFETLGHSSQLRCGHHGCILGRYWEDDQRNCLSVKAITGARQMSQGRQLRVGWNRALPEHVTPPHSELTRYLFASSLVAPSLFPQFS